MGISVDDDIHVSLSVDDKNNVVRVAQRMKTFEEAEASLERAQALYQKLIVRLREAEKALLAQLWKEIPNHDWKTCEQPSCIIGSCLL